MRVRVESAVAEVAAHQGAVAQRGPAIDLAEDWKSLTGPPAWALYKARVSESLSLVVLHAPNANAMARAVINFFMTLSGRE